jgi:hypothetical protein
VAGGCVGGVCAPADDADAANRIARNIAQTASAATNFGERNQFARRVEWFRAAFKAAFRAARIDHMSRKLRII